MVSIFKKSTMAALGTLLVVGFNQTALASTAEITTEGGNRIGVGVPKSQSSPVLYLGEDSNPLESKINQSQDRVKRTITIDPSSTDTTVEIPFEFRDGEYLVLGKDSKGDTNGSANIYNKEGKSLVIVSVKATENKTDLIDAEVKNGNTLVLNVQADTLTQPTNVEVVAAATYYSTYFSSFAWITRDGVKSLSLTPTSYTLNAPDPGEAAVRMIDSWNKLYAVHSSSSNWYNTGGMKDQYECHYNFAKAKTPWNLEPSRPDVSYTATVAALCNP